MDPLKFNDPGQLITDDMLADPAWRGFHKFVKWALAACGIGMLIEALVLPIYIVLRFGWGGT